jgi:ferredoxin
MKAEVNKALCISCGACKKLCPEVYDIGSENKAYVKVKDVPEFERNDAINAEENCPTDAITIII